MFLKFNLGVERTLLQFLSMKVSKVTTACHSDLANVSQSQYLYVYVVCWIFKLAKVFLDEIIA